MKILNQVSTFKRRPIVIPNNKITNTFFAKFIGKSLNHFLENHVRIEYRNNIAHLGFKKGNFDANGNMKLPAADNMINTSVAATNAVLIEVINEAIKEEINIMKKII